MRSRADLREQQRLIDDAVFTRDAVQIIAHMGSGKTGATLSGLRRLIDIGDVRRVLVVAPLLVAREVWGEEAAEWEHLRHLDVAVCVGEEKKRLEALARKATITAINREMLPWLWEQIGGLGGWDWDTVVIDESSMFKAGVTRRGTNKRSRKTGPLTRFGVMAAARPKINRVIELTGTPAPNGHEDLWGQIYLLDQGFRLGASKNAFLTRWFHQSRYSYDTEIRAGAAEEIEGLIADLLLSLPKLQIVPEPYFVPIKVDLPPAVMKEYKRFERTLVSDVYDVEAVSKGVLTGKLLQFANGSLYRPLPIALPDPDMVAMGVVDDLPGRQEREVVHVHDEKLKALDTLVEQVGGDNVIVFYSFQFDLETIRARYPDAVVLNESDTAVKDWNAGKIRMLLAHPASCAHGLNLQYGGHIAIWYGFTWSLELYQQANARLPRAGQKHQVVIYQIIARGTLDEKLLGVLGDKASTQDSITKAVRDRLLALT